MRFIKNINIKIALLVVIVFTFGFTLSDSDYFFKVNKSIDIYGRVYKELTLNYVDEIDPEVFMEAGIDGMLKSLDPYTNFISSSEASDMDLITTGKYGGIGISIGMRDGTIIITSLMEGYTAQRQGLKIGDQILDVDGKSLANVKLEDIRHLTRGEPGTEVKVKVKREGEAKPLEFVLIREEIKLKNISYAEFVKDGIVLIYNGSNASNYNDPALPKFTYSAGQALFDKENPYKLISRLDEHFIFPDKPYEKTGEVNEVCFVEGLVYFKNQWLLYYGTADSKIAVAIRTESKKL